MIGVIVVVTLLWVPATVWALGESLRIGSWRWVVTLALFPPYATLAWFIAARRCYGYRGLGLRRPT